MKKLLLCLTLILLTLPLPAHAQEEPPCEPDYTHATELWDSAQTALEDGDYTAAIDTFRELRRELARVESECLGLNMAGEGELVTDVLVIPEGVYRVKVTHDGNFITVRGTPIEGACGADYVSESSANLMYGDTEELQTVFESEGCEILLEFDADGAWTIEFEKIK